MATTARKDLLDELAAETVNILRVRKLCRENPGVIDLARLVIKFPPNNKLMIFFMTGLVATTGLRVRIWVLLLLGAQHGIEETEDILFPDGPCEEQHVLEADVKRTRADMEDFRTTSWRKAVQETLQGFCLKHGIQYKQGMNEVN